MCGHCGLVMRLIERSNGRQRGYLNSYVTSHIVEKGDEVKVSIGISVQDIMHDRNGNDNKMFEVCNSKGVVIIQARAKLNYLRGIIIDLHLPGCGSRNQYSFGSFEGEVQAEFQHDGDSMVLNCKVKRWMNRVHHTDIYRVGCFRVAVDSVCKDCVLSVGSRYHLHYLVRTLSDPIRRPEMIENEWATIDEMLENIGV